MNPGPGTDWTKLESLLSKDDDRGPVTTIHLNRNVRSTSSERWVIARVPGPILQTSQKLEQTLVMLKQPSLSQMYLSSARNELEDQITTRFFTERPSDGLGTD